MKWIKKIFGGARRGDAPDMVSCHEALERLYEYLDGELEGVQSDRVAEHFRICQQCYPRLAFERTFLDAVHRVDRGEAAPDALRIRVLDLLRAEGLDGN
jgi:anti-sigma factor (TIGR02949 family)